jgi:DNA-dependent RNA polymerase auxiliary subunit epsilon
MKYFTFEVPYRETVYGTTTFLVEADSEQEARELMDKESYKYYWDSEQDCADNYEEFYSELKLTEVKEL